MMTRNLSLTLLFALGAAAVTGCAADAPTDTPPDNNGDPGGGNGGDGTPPTPPPTTVEGRYSVQSDFDLTNMPGTAGTIANYFIQATDDPDDPTRFIVQLLVDQLPNGSIKNTLNGAIPFVAGYLNDRLLDVAPDFVTTIVSVGDKFGQVAHHFGTLEQLDVAASGMTTKTVQGLHFKIDNIDMDFNFADYNMQTIKIENVRVALDTGGKLTIGEHKMQLHYGQVLKLALDQGIIPLIDPAASNLGDLLRDVVNCQAVGQYTYDALGIGSPSTFESACNAGLNAAEPALYSALDHLDASALEFDFTNGTARAIDKNHDGKIDDIATGVYTGQVQYAGSPAPMLNAKFFGSKM